MGDYGIKIAKATKDISSSTPGDFHFWSKYRAKSIKYQGALQVITTDDVDASPVTNSYTHDFGYIPQFMVFVGDTYSSNRYVNCNYTAGGAYGKDGDLWLEVLKAHATSSAIVVSADLNYFTPQSGTWTGIIRTYTFDILLFMEEVETS